MLVEVDFGRPGAEFGQARPAVPAIRAEFLAPAAVAYIAWLDPVAQTVSRAHEYRVLLRQAEASLRMARERDLVAAPVVMALHCSSDASETASVR